MINFLEVEWKGTLTTDEEEFHEIHDRMAEEHEQEEEESAKSP